MIPFTRSHAGADDETAIAGGSVGAMIPYLTLAYNFWPEGSQLPKTRRSSSVVRAAGSRRMACSSRAKTVNKPSSVLSVT